MQDFPGGRKVKARRLYDGPRNNDASGKPFRGGGAFARARGPRTFECRRPPESGVALRFPPQSKTPRARTGAGSRTSRSTFAGLAASEMINTVRGAARCG
jgi:hypothetical protein